MYDGTSDVERVIFFRIHFMYRTLCTLHVCSCVRLHNPNPNPNSVKMLHSFTCESRAQPTCLVEVDLLQFLLLSFITSVNISCACPEHGLRL